MEEGPSGPDRDAAPVERLPDIRLELLKIRRAPTDLRADPAELPPGLMSGAKPREKFSALPAVGQVLLEALRLAR
jgi:hypothetical protein